MQQHQDLQRQFKPSPEFWQHGGSRGQSPGPQDMTPNQPQQPLTPQQLTPQQQHTPNPQLTPNHNQAISQSQQNQLTQQQSQMAQQLLTTQQQMQQNQLAPVSLHQQGMNPAQMAAGAVPNMQQMLSAPQDHKMITEKLVNEIQIFMHKNAMQMHARELQRGLAGGDVKPHQCQQCLKSFSSNHQLVQHIRVHTGEKPYKCSYCDRRFKQLSHVQQHTRLHTDERPYRCFLPDCGRAFIQLSNLQQHLRNHDAQVLKARNKGQCATSERPYKCHLPDCGRAFIQLSNLQQHLRNHDAQVERAKNRPFHCNICGKGFATESSLRTHTSKELQLHLGVLQQHAALMIGGPAATPCPICHKLVFGGEALMEHMKNTHKDPNASGVATYPALPSPLSATNNSSNQNPPTPSNGSTGGGAVSMENNLSMGSPPPGPLSLAPPNLPYPPHQAALKSNTDPYTAKRRTANHPCPVCGKHYVNEGSLRKHLACHPETQLTSSLRMWPCSVCQAVFTHESGLLSHMEHMRMEPKHQFAAQYVLSRAAAERRERETALLAAVSASGSGLLLGSGSLCASPSAHSDSSSTGRPSSAGSDIAPNNNNNCGPQKLGDLLRTAATNNGHHQQYNPEDIHNANRMAAIAAAAAGIMGQAQGGVQNALGSPVDSAVQAAAASLAAAMRLNNAHNVHLQQQHQQQMMENQSGTPPMGGESPSAAQQQAMNVATMRSMADSMRSMANLENQLNQQQQPDPTAALRMQQAEALLRSQAEAALRLAVSQATAGVESNAARHNGGFPQNMEGGPTGPARLSPDLGEALRMAQEQRLEQALRLHGDPRMLGFGLPHSPSPNLQQNPLMHQNQHQVQNMQQNQHLAQQNQGQQP